MKNTWLVGMCVVSMLSPLGMHAAGDAGEVVSLDTDSDTESIGIDSDVESVGIDDKRGLWITVVDEDGRQISEMDIRQSLADDDAPMWIDTGRRLVVSSRIAGRFQETSRARSVHTLLDESGSRVKIGSERLAYGVAMLYRWFASKGEEFFITPRWFTEDGGRLRPGVDELTEIARVLEVPLSDIQVHKFLIAQEGALVDALGDFDAASSVAAAGGALGALRAAMVGHTYVTSPYCWWKLYQQELASSKKGRFRFRDKEKERQALNALWEAFVFPKVSLTAMLGDPACIYNILLHCGAIVCQWLLDDGKKLKSFIPVPLSVSVADRLSWVGAYFQQEGSPDYCPDYARAIDAFVAKHASPAAALSK